MERIDLNRAVNFALNNFIAPRVRILNIKYLSSKDQYKVRCSETIQMPARCTLYFDKSFIENCLNAYNRGVRKWAQK